MKVKSTVALLCLAAPGLVAASVLTTAAQAAPPPGTPAAPVALQQSHPHHAACGAAAPGTARCDADVLDAGTSPASASGLTPTNISGVYGFNTTNTSGSGTTVAIVDANNDPTAASDLATFSSQYGLPTPNLRQVNQTGGSALPTTDGGWALEISLDIEWVHSVAPGANILLVEANSASFNDLLTAESYAASQASWVSNSWSSGEFLGESAYDSSFPATSNGHPVTYFFATGDTGLPANYPATSPDVVAVGGTSLQFNGPGSTFNNEVAWSGGGGGCSSYESAPSAQLASSNAAGCGGRRATPDVSLDADPNSGVSVYDSTPDQGQAGWFVVGGTSLATPMWAARTAIAGLSITPTTIYSTAT
ncbi:MAG TPA: hypothetical protein VGI06_08420, partial [Acidimicrobiales bacterium]